MLRASFGWIGTGVTGGIDTLHRMKGLVRNGYGLPIVRETATWIVRGTGTDSRLQAVRIRAWLTRYVGFLRDPYQLEGLHEPDAMLEMLSQEGRLEVDCDDVAVLGAALGMAVGLPARFVALGHEAYEHVFTELGDPLGGEWIELDITRPWQDVAADFPKMLVVEV